MFQERLHSYMHIPVDEQPLEYSEIIFDIVEGEQNFSFDFEELRLHPILSLCAALLALWKEKRVVFICPTSYYGAQASRFIRAFLKTEKIDRVTVCPSAWVTEDLACSTNVFMHHGRDFRDSLPKCALEKRHVYQIFSGEEVPNDSRSLSSLVHAAQYQDDD